MAYTGTLTQNNGPDAALLCTTPSDSSHAETTTDMYDLDDPYLIHKLCDRPPNLAGPVTCRFVAIPLGVPATAPPNLEQYGQIVLESKDKLLMRIPARNLPFLGCIRQIWVSRYLELHTECRITFDLPKQDPEQTTTVIIQRAGPKMEKDPAGASVVNAPAPAVEGGQEPTIPAGQYGADAAGEGIRGFENQRRRAASLPSHTILEALGKTRRRPLPQIP